jgi:type I restriction-modification system DNA methylase subunit
MANEAAANTDLDYADTLWKAADALRGQVDAAEYKCKAEAIEGIGKHGFLLTPGRYVGAEVVEDDGELFVEKFPRLLAELEACFGEGERLMAVVREQLKGVGDAG